MGLSVAASHAVIGTAIIAVAFSLVVQGLNTWERLEDARDVQESLHESKVHSSLQINSVSWSGSPTDELTVKVNNTGSATLNATLVDVLLDGTVSSDSVATRTVDGVATTRLFAPGQQLVLVITGVTAEPTTSVKVVAENGISAVWVMT